MRKVQSAPSLVSLAKAPHSLNMGNRGETLRVQALLLDMAPAPPVHEHHLGGSPAEVALVIAREGLISAAECLPEEVVMQTAPQLAGDTDGKEMAACLLSSSSAIPEKSQADKLRSRIASMENETRAEIR
jgi:hypothetical protein